MTASHPPLSFSTGWRNPRKPALRDSIPMCANHLINRAQSYAYRRRGSHLTDMGGATPVRCWSGGSLRGWGLHSA